MSDERRLVTILFADVTGSTALGESLDPRLLDEARRFKDFGGSPLAAWARCVLAI